MIGRLRRIAPQVAVVWFTAFMGMDILFNRIFSHIAMPRPPFFVTEWTLLVVTVLLIVTRQFLFPGSIRFWLGWVFVVCAAGFFLNAGRYGLLPVMRDSAELYYMWFIPLSFSVYHLASRYVTRERVERGLLVAGFVTPVVYLLTRTHQLPAASESIAAMLLLAQVSWPWAHRWGRLFWVNLPLDGLALVEPGARGPWVGFALGACVLLGLSFRMRHGSLVRRRMAWVAAGSAVAMVAVLVGDPRTMFHIFKDMVSIFQVHGHYVQIANNRWRLIIWGEALRQIASNPLAIRVGQHWIPQRLVALGYGGIHTGGYALNTVALANSYLQMIQWYGIWAFIPTMIIAVTAIRGLLSLAEQSPLAVVLLTSLTIWAVVTGVEVVWEGPYMSTIIWSLVGAAFFLSQRKDGRWLRHETH